MSRRGVGWWAVATLVALAVGGPDPAGQAPESGFSLRPCQSGAEGGRGECGRLTVFENRAARRGRRIDIHFMVLRAEKPGARQALFLFGGGPGQGSTALAPAADLWAKPVRASQAIVDATEGTFLGRYLFDEYRHACANWPRGAIRADARTPVTARVPTLLISGWFDPSTPTQFAERVAQTLSEHRLLVAPSGAHVSAFSCAGPAAGHVLATGSFAGMPAVCGQ